MLKKDILIFGASYHCKYAIDIIEQEGNFQIIGILDDTIPAGENFIGYKILGKIKDLPKIKEFYNVNKGLIGIGDNYTRFKITEIINKMVNDFEFVTAIHPSVIIGKNVEIGDGTLIMAGVIINNDTLIGKNCFLATKSSIDHDSIMLDYSSLAPGVTTGGNVKIGYCTAVGIGANILHGKTIGDHSVVGAGSLVLKDIVSNIIAYGNPVKEIRQRKIGDKYL